MKIPLKYRVLESIAASCDDDGYPQRPLYEVIAEAFPKLETKKARSIVAALQSDGLLGYPREMPDGKIYCALTPISYSKIVSEWEKVDMKKEDRRVKFEVALFGFVLGVVGGFAPSFIKYAFFGICDLVKWLISFIS